MCNDRSNNLDHSNQVHIWERKMKMFRSLKDQACFLCEKHYKILARSIGCEENSITIVLWVNCFVCINKEKWLHAGMIAYNIQFSTRYYVRCFDKSQSFSMTIVIWKVICAYMNRSDHTTEQLMHCNSRFCRPFSRFVLHTCWNNILNCKQCSTAGI